MPNTSSGTTPQPPSLEKRLPIALALMMLVLLASQYIFKPAPGPKPVKPVNNEAAAHVATPPTPAALPQTETLPAAGVPTGQIQAGSEVVTDVDTDLYHVVFTNRGAAIKSWVLKQYKDDAGKPLQVINTAATDVPLPFTIQVTGNQKLSVDPNTVLYQPKVS